MKKLVFMFVAMAAISFASCGNSEKAGEGNADSDSVAAATVEAPADSNVADSGATEAPAATDSVVAE